jgi:hypothetical protein
MSRAATGDVNERKAGTNIYTVLVVIATLITGLGVLAVFLRSQALFNEGLF